MNKKTILIIVIIIFALGCATPNILPYKDTKDPADAGVLVEWRF